MLRKLYLLLLFVYTGTNIFAQPLSAYTNLQGEMVVWDNNIIRKTEYLPPQQVKIGRTAIPYLDNSKSFKIYYGGGVVPVNIGFTNAFYATDNLVGYLNQKALFVFDRGVSKNLTGICDQYFIADSLIFYLDAVKSEYKVYYNGQIYTAESYFSDSVLNMIKVSDNIIAYNNFANQFHIFYHGNITVQEEYTVRSFKAGRNTVAYVDADNKFKIFHSGQTFLIDDFPPQSYQVGDNLVAFVSGDGYFKIFYEDSVRNIGYGKASYRVGDNVVAFSDQTGFLKVFYKGAITDMENYYPDKMVIQYNSLAYINTSNTLRLFTEGETYDVTNAELTNWQLNYDVIQYQIGIGMFRIYYKGNEY